MKTVVQGRNENGNVIIGENITFEKSFIGNGDWYTEQRS